MISWSIVDMIFSTIWLVFRSKWPTRIKLKNKKYMLYLHSKFSGSLVIWLKSQNSNTENYNNKIQKKVLWWFDWNHKIQTLKIITIIQKKEFRNSCLTWASYYQTKMKLFFVNIMRSYSLLPLLLLTFIYSVT